MQKHLRMRHVAIAATLLLAACTPPAPDDGTPGVDLTPAPAALTSTYQLTSQFEVPATVAAPGPLGDSLRLLHSLSVNPAGALLDLAEAAGTPALGELRMVLPDSLEDQLEGWMNDSLNATTVNGTSPHARIVALDDLVRSVLLDWDLRSTLDLPAGGSGTHTPVALVFSAGGDPVVVPTDLTAPVTAATGVVATVSWASAGAAPIVTIGDHAMGIPFGHYAMIGLDGVLERQLGAAGIGPALDAMVDCAAVARSVAGQCVGVGFAAVCVGHESELTAICEAGLDEATAELEERILGIDFKAIHFVSGTAAVEGILVDTGAATATGAGLSGGDWESTIDLGQEPEAATATFTATR